MSGFAHGQRVAKGDRWVCADCGQTVGWLRQAFNYKRLQKENYYKTPEGRAVIEMIERRYPNDSRVRDWLLKLAKNNKLIVSPPWQTDINLLREGEASGDPQIVQSANERLDGHRPDIVLWRTDKNDERGMPEPVQPGIVLALGQMLDQGYKGKGIDLMNMSFDEVEALYEDWEQTHKRDPKAGEVVHAYPDGWTVRRLEDPDQAFAEGAEMRNCVPQYAPAINDGTAHIFSLRDELNRPHANVLISPRDRGGHWEGGAVKDIRGKANSTPMDKYAEYLRHWFDTFNHKPAWSPNPGPPGDPGPGTSGRYGLGEATHAFSSVSEGWIFESAWEVESSWNRVRNQLRHNDQFDESTEALWTYLKALYGYKVDPKTGEVKENSKNDRLAEWLMREIKNGNIKMPSFVNDRLDDIRLSNETLDNYRERISEIERSLREYETGVLPSGMEYEDVVAAMAELRDHLAGYKNSYAAQLEKNETRKAQISDPKTIHENVEKTRKAYEDETLRIRQKELARILPSIDFPEEKSFDGQPLVAVIDNDWLASMQDIVKGRQDKAKVVRKDPKAYQNKIAEIRAQIRELDTSDPAYDGKLEALEGKLADYQKRIEDAENSDLNTLNANTIGKEVQEQTWLRRLAKDGGKVIHTFPDGKTVRWINSKEVAQLEGDIMGHCMGTAYADQCASGESVNVSIRDKRGMPHATMELKEKRNPTIDWDKFFEDVKANPAKYEALSEVDVETGSPSQYFRHDFRYDGLLGNPVMYDGEPVLNEEGVPFRIGDFVFATPSGGPGFHGWIDGANVSGLVGVHRSDGIQGAGPNQSWTVRAHQIHPAQIPEPTPEDQEPPEDQELEDSPDALILEIKNRAARWMNQEPGAVSSGLPQSDFQLSRALIAADAYMPAFEGSDAHQIQGKGNKIPDQRYHKYVRDFFDSFSDEDRPRSVWSSYFASKPVQYVDHLGDLDKGVDELGAKVEGERGIDWDAIIHSANESSPQMVGSGDCKYFAPIESDEAEYDPGRGQKIFEAAKDRGGMRDLFKSMIGLDRAKTKENPLSTDPAAYDEEELQQILTNAYHAHPETHYSYEDDYDTGDGGHIPGMRPGGNSNPFNSHFVYGRCPDCNQDAWLRDDRDDELFHYHCPSGGRYFTNEEVYSAQNGIPAPRQQRGPTGGPNYTPYAAAMVQHLGPQIEEYFRTQASPSDYQWALHGAPKSVTMQCPACGSSDIAPCNQCQPADHYICKNCGAMIGMQNGMYNHQAKVSEGIEGCPYNHGRRRRLHIGNNGNICACLYHPTAHVDVQRSMVKQADKMNDFLMNPAARPDLQTPEAQQFLQLLQDRYHSPKTDPLMPWLTREWKKKRLYTSPSAEGLTPNVLTFAWPNDRIEYRPLNPDEVNHWADWYHSDHPTRRGVDIMQMQAPDMLEKINEWEDAMQKASGGAAIYRGQVDHEWPDGWTVQRLEGQRPLTEEGRILSHCIGGYHQRVRDGNHIVYSLRDQDNVPQCSWAIVANRDNDYCPNCKERVPPYNPEMPEPDEDGWTKVPGPRPNKCLDCDSDTIKMPHGGEMEQIQARGNSAPTTEMQRRIKDWVKARFNDGSGGADDDRPQWSGHISEVNDYDQLDGQGYTEYHPGDYGLEKPVRDMYWDDILYSLDFDNWSLDRPNPNVLMNAANEQADAYAEIGQDYGELGLTARSPHEALQNSLNAWWEGVNLDAERNYAEHVTANMVMDEFGHDAEDFPCQNCDGTGKVSYDEEGGEDYCPHCGGEGVDFDDAKATLYDDWFESEHADQRDFFEDLSLMLRSKTGASGAEYGPRRLGKAIPCHTCGDPTENGFCPRCDWGGQAAGADWADKNPPSVKRDIADGFQASVKPYDWALDA